ncbi:MAG TPA: hypothetical protein VKG92_09375 [Flavobacteriales bacterium]|nr:hypothetical protein [Flavobacteriales bacterium]
MRTVILRQVLLVMLATTLVQDAAAQAEASLWRPHGLDVSWDRSGSERIAYSMKGSDGYYDVHTADPDGGRDSCLTCAYAGLPVRHVAAPDWSPDGQWLLVTAEKAEHRGSSFVALPGLGGFTDIWMIRRDGTGAVKLVETVADKHHGVIMPRFSHDGRHITWTDRVKKANVLSLKRAFGYWTINTADIAWSADGTPTLANIRVLSPGGGSFHEGYGFSPDDRRILFCSSMNGRSVWDQDIYTMDTNGGDIQRLTHKDYNEHAFYTPAGDRIVWMSNRSGDAGTDWWMMRSDGSDPQRLTYFNAKKDPRHAGRKVWCGMGSFNAQGDAFVGGRQVSLTTQEGQIMFVRLVP